MVEYCKKGRKYCRCPECGSIIEENVKECSKCGYPIKKELQTKAVEKKEGKSEKTFL